MIITLLLTLLMLLTIYWDARRYLIPNWLVLGVVILYPLYLFLAPEGVEIDWKIGLIAAGVAFVIGFILFNFRVMGGGDVKMLAACFLWVPADAIIRFIIYVGLLGGALTIGLLLMRPIVTAFIARTSGDAKQLPRLFTHGEPVPYGLAIAGGMLLLLWHGNIYSL